MNGEYDIMSSNLLPAQAQNLVFQTQLFYVLGDKKKLNLVEQFHKNPNAFDYTKVIEEVQKLWKGQKLVDSS